MFCKKKCCCKPEPEPTPTPVAPCCPDFYGQYTVAGNPTTGTKIPLFESFSYGDQLVLEDSNVTLPAGYLYQISYQVYATVEPEGSIQVATYVNGTTRLPYTGYGVSANTRNAYAQGTFTINEAWDQEAQIYFIVFVNGKVQNLDLSGNMSITPMIQKNT